MFISISILLLLLFVLGFWIIKESKAPNLLKVLSITLFFCFCVVMSSTLESSLGWAANGKNVPKIVTIRHVVIKEPNQQMNFDGAIYLLLEMPPTKYDSVILKMFGHKSERSEPRLFRLIYNREMHESLQKNVIPRLMKGQVVRGRFGKPGDADGDGDGQGGNGKGKGKGKGKGGRGGGSESIEPNDIMFYDLPPSYFQQKDDPDANKQIQ